MATKISPEEELGIIIQRARGYTWREITKHTGHNASAIARVLDKDHLCNIVTEMSQEKEFLKSDATFYEKWLCIALGVWGISSAINLAIYFIY